MINKDTFYELTIPQKNIWHTEQFFQNTCINNICGSLLIKKNVNLELLNLAINYFIKNNDSFKLRFKKVGSNLMQYFAEDEFFNFEIINIKKESQIEEFAKTMVNTRFDLTNSRVFDFKLFKLDSGYGGFIVNCHHIISDAATFSFIATEVMQNYSKLLKNEDIENKDFSYLDYINSEKEYLNSPRFEKDKSYWEDILSPLPDVVSVFSTNTNDISNDFRANRKEFILNKSLLDNIKNYCAKNKISLFNFLIGIYSIYFGKINDMDKFNFGTPILNRTNSKEKHTSGMFISTSLLKIDISQNLSFIEFLQNIAKNCIGMFRHQKYDYGQILENLRKKDKSISKLYDIGLSYQITQATNNSIDIPYSTKWYGTDYVANTLDVHFHDNDNTGNLLVEYDYQISKLDDLEISNIHNRIIEIINQVLKNENIYINDIDIITKKEKNQILNDFNNTSANFPNNKTVIDLFEQHVNLAPKDIALIYKDEKLTYEALNKKANQFANFLNMTYNITPNSIISVCMDKNISFIITILGILKLGCAYLPINPSYPEDRINYIILDSNSKLVISNKKLNIKNNVVFSTINLDNFSYEKIELKSNKDSLAYVIYTSGSTGNPKGVLLTNSNVMNFLHSFNDCFNKKFDKFDNCLSLTNISFDVSVCEIFTPLCFGSTLVLYEENILNNLNTLVNSIIKNKITFMYIPPNILDNLYENLYKEKNNVKLNKLLVGVESIKNSSLNNYYNINNSIEIINGYGPTETTICCSFYKFNKTSISNDKKIVPIGKPLKNNKILILNKTLNIKPINVPGIIYVSGKNVSNGYLGKEDLTKLSFININNKIYYKTGDLGYFDENGNIHFLGRIDNQIKVRGYRIELGEITNTLNKIDGIESAFSTIIDIKKKPYVCSYIVSKTLSSKEVKNILKKHLPYYMIPSFIKQIDSMPINLNGKVDKSKLPTDFINNSTENIEHASTVTENFLLNLFLKNLNLKTMSVTDDFFDLGTDSLTCIKIISEISSVLNIDIKISDLFENTCIRSLAKLIDKKSKNSNLIIPHCEIKDYYELSSAQKRIYYSSYVLNRDSISYNIPFGILLDKIPDIQKLESCFNKLIQRHESLRTYFEIIDGNPVQKIADNVEFKIEVTNGNRNLIEHYFEEFIKPFNLKQAPILRVNLIKFKNNTALLLFDTHHIIFDGTSMEIFISELCKLYNDEELLPINLTYKDYAVWENENLKNDTLNKSKKFWLNQFQDEIPVLNLPYNHLRPAKQTFKGAKLYKVIDENNFNKINSICKELKVTPYMFLLSIYYILLSKYSMQDDIIIGTPIAARENIETSNIIGMFVNSLPLRMKIDFNLNFEDFLQNVKKMCLNSFEHQSYPFNEIVNNLNINRQLNRNPLFDVLFTYQNLERPNFKLNEINTTYVVPDNKIAKFDLSVEVVPENNKLNLSFEYSTSLFKTNFINNLANHYLNILENILANSKIKICDIDMLSTREKNKILVEFNKTEMDYPKDKSLIDLFKTQVKNNSSNIAVTHNKKSITYKELDEKSNTVALEILKNKNVHKGDIIGLYMNKSIEFIISLWGILKTGCTYMPMFIDYPEDRLNYMIYNSNCPLIITNKQNTNFEVNTINISNFEKIKNTLNLENTPNIEPNDIAYVIYTSGSTGKPKGVKITHKNLNNYIHSFNKLFKNISYKDRFLCSTNVSFDVSIWELFLSILNGATLVIYKEEIIKNILEYAESIIKDKITTLYIPPNILEDVFCLLENKPDVKIDKLLVGVEPIKSQTLNKFYQINPNLKIINGYGPTETTICSTALEYENSTKKEKIVSIGKPIGNTKIYIVDKFMNILPIGVPGELLITGDGVGKGYIQNEAETNKNFIENKFNTISNTAYKTGDIAKWNNDGTLTYIARKDTQIKLSGYRIELTEIDNWIIKYPSIFKCLSTIYKTKEKSYLVTYFTANKKINILELTAFLQTKLPFYMVPNILIQLDNFPLTVNGKIDTKNLPKPIISTTAEYVAPTNEIEKTLCNIWENLFGIKKVGIQDNFFSLGGDSLSAIRLQVEALNHNLNITYADIFKYPTIKLLATKAHNNISTNIDNFKDYDYSKINNLIKYNDIKYIPPKIELKPIGNILLTGATGFLGAHILDEYFENNNFGTIYCLIRVKNKQNPEERLKEVLNFYFGDKYNNFIGEKIKIIVADSTKYKFGLNDTEYRKLAQKVDIVINSAALVKHYGDYNKFYSINVLGTKNIIDFCKKYNKKLYHISTTSVSGLGLPENRLVQNQNITYFSEKDLYKNQNLNNTYLQTKFEAEKLILEEIANNKLNATILRMGNISNRYLDGKFQINHSENAFVNRVNDILKLGVLQNGFKKHATEFLPVDFAGKAIINLIQSMPKFTIFHIFNTNLISFVDLVKYINELNIKLDFVTDTEFSDKVIKFLKDPLLKNEISGIVTELDNDKKFKIVSNILMDCNFSTTYLNKIGFNWPIIDKGYITKYIEYFKNINYFKY